MDKFYALSAPVRREIIALLSEGVPLPSTTIANKFRLTPPAISQHLKVLLNSGLVRMHKVAQQRIYELNPVEFLELETWSQNMVKDSLKVLVEKKPNNVEGIENV